MRCKICHNKVKNKNTNICFECKIRVNAKTDSIKANKGKINLNFSEHRFYSRSKGES